MNKTVMKTRPQSRVCTGTGWLQVKGVATHSASEHKGFAFSERSPQARNRLPIALGLCVGIRMN